MPGAPLQVWAQRLPAAAPSLWIPDAVSFLQALLASSQVSQYEARSTVLPKDNSTLSAGTRVPSLAPAGRPLPPAALGWICREAEGMRRGAGVSVQ